LTNGKPGVINNETAKHSLHIETVCNTIQGKMTDQKTGGFEAAKSSFRTSLSL
jgi:hypothetical protein